MQSETTTAITAVKQDVRLREWAEQLEAQQASGLTVPQWCAENGIKTKSFYYRLRRVREQYIQSAHAVVPLTVPQQQSADIRIEKNGLHISLPTNITQDTLLALNWKKFIAKKSMEIRDRETVYLRETGYENRDG